MLLKIMLYIFFGICSERGKIMWPRSEVVVRNLIKHSRFGWEIRKGRADNYVFDRECYGFTPAKGIFLGHLKAFA